MEEYYVIHTTEPDKLKRDLLVLSVVDGKPSLLVNRVGKDIKKRVVEKVQPISLANILDEYEISG